MLAFIVRRILSTVPVMAVVGIVVFVLLQMAPGDPAALMGGQEATAEDLAFLREAMGLDRPLHEKFALWAGKVLQGDLGSSLYSRKPVTFLMAQRMEPTLVLALTTTGLSVILAVPMGVLAAWKAGTNVDRLIMMLAVLGFSIPGFWLGFLFIYAFSVQLQWTAVQGFASITQGLGPFLAHVALPTITLASVYIALIARMTRATMLEVLSEDYIRTAFAKGLPPVQVLMRHALKNASVPIVTIIGYGIALLISGVVVVETVFAVPGLGTLTVDALLNRDYPVISGIILVFSGVYVLINLAIDISYTVLDPRIRY